MMLSAAEPRRKQLTALFIDGEFAVNVDTMTYVQSGLKPGQEITDERLHELICQSDARRAQEKALYLLEYRARSKKELRDRVARATSRDAAEKAVARLEELGLVDDKSYAKSLASELFGRKCYAASRVRYELMKKGIGRELAETVLAETAPDPQEKLRELVGHKYRRALRDEAGRRRTAAALQRLGYRWDDIKDVLNEYIIDEDELL